MPEGLRQLDLLEQRGVDVVDEPVHLQPALPYGALDEVASQQLLSLSAHVEQSEVLPLLSDAGSRRELQGALLAQLLDLVEVGVQVSAAGGWELVASAEEAGVDAAAVGVPADNDLLDVEHVDGVLEGGLGGEVVVEDEVGDGLEGEDLAGAVGETALVVPGVGAPEEESVWLVCGGGKRREQSWLLCLEGVCPLLVGDQQVAGGVGGLDGGQYVGTHGEARAKRERSESETSANEVSARVRASVLLSCVGVLRWCIAMVYCPRTNSN